MNKEELKNKIVSYNNSYRSGNAEISDSEYDALVDTFKSEYPEEYDEFRNTLNEGTIESGNKKVSHGEFIMGSLDKLPIEKPDDITSFLEKYCSRSVNISAKVDGISCRLEYRNGKLFSATTRGDGYIGMDITNKIQYVKHIPKTINKDTMNVRGELVILKDDFETMEGYSNPRNACAGIMNRTESSKDWNTDEISKITFVAYTILGSEYSKEEQFKILYENDFFIAWNNTIQYKKDIILDKLRNLQNEVFPYETDGFVISSPDYHNEDEYRPYAQMAIKYNNLTAITKLIDIEWNRPSKDGKISVVGIIDPVELGGAMISRVTLNNLDFIRSLGLMYGSTISITKRGDIIPAITSVISNDDTCTPIVLPSVCPCCGNPLTEEGPFLWCKNAECQDQTTYQVQHFIENLGVEHTSFKSLQKYNIYTIDDLVKYTPNKKYKNEIKFYDEIKNKIFTKSERDIFCSMNFKGLGEIILGKIIDHYGIDHIKGFTSSGKSACVYFCTKPDGVGEIMINKFVEGLDSALKYTSMITSDERYNPTSRNECPVEKTDISVCFTGSLNTMSRGVAQKKAESVGWTAKSSVTKGLTYLVTNESTMTTKMKKALEFGTKIINEDEFLKLISSDNRIDDL